MEEWAEIANIWEQYKEQTLRRVAVIERTVIALRERTLTAELRRQAQGEAHTLAGSVGSLGFSEGTRLAHEIESIFRANALIDQAQIERLSEMVASLRTELERPVSAPQEAAPMSQGPPVLLIIDRESEPAHSLELAAAAEGLHVIHATDLLAARIMREEAKPCMVLLDLACADSVQDSLLLLEAWSHSIPPVPVLVLSAQDILAHRLEVARLGGCGFLLKPVSPQHILAMVRLALQPLPDATSVVLALSDVPHVQVTLQSLLEPYGVQLTIFSDPQAFWDTLLVTTPELLIFDTAMAACDAVALCQALRQDDRWRAISVLMLSAELDTTTLERFAAVGADAYLATPLAGPALIAQVSYSIKRTRWIRRTAAHDTLLGIATQGHARQIINTLLYLARRHHQYLTLAVIVLDQRQEFSAYERAAACDAVLRRLVALCVQTFRSEDVIARWQGDELVVGLYSMPRDLGVHRLADVLDAMRQTTFTSVSGVPFTAAFSAGVAAYPMDGNDLNTLYDAAAQMCRRAQDAGGNCVLPVGWRPAHEAISQNYDVVLVEDDAPLAEVLRRALETRGHRVYCLHDGQEAMDALGGPQPTLRAQLVVLDVSLPNLDGLTLLRRLGQDGVLRKTRVIMLTFHSSEAEVLEALELGAFDHVAKPFSLPVLMQRIRRALTA